MNGTLTSFYTEAIASRPWSVIILITIILLLTGYGIKSIEFTSDYRVFFSEDNPELNAFEAMQNIYTKTDNVLIVVAAPSGNGFNQKTLALVHELTELSWHIPYSTRVDSVTNYQHTVAEQEDLIVADLYDGEQSLTAEKVEEIKAVALSEPLLVNRLVSPTGHVFGINTTIQLPGKSITEVGEVAQYARKVVGEIARQYPEHKLYLTGIAMMNNAFSESAIGDMMTLVPIMFITIIVVLGLLLRSVSATFAVVIMIMMSIIISMGIMGWYDLKLTSASAAAPTIITTMAVADAVHILVTFFYNMRQGMDKVSAIKDSLQINFMPILITSVTTAIGFLSMNLSDVPPFHDLGNTVAIGVIAAFFLSITLLPVLILLLPIKGTPSAKKRSVMMNVIADKVILHRSIILVVTSLTAILLMMFISHNQLDDQFVEYFDETIDFRSATDFSSENLSGIYTLQYSLIQGETGGISEPSFLEGMARFVSWLREQPEVMHVQSVSDTYKRLNKNMHYDDPDYYVLPEQREIAAQYLLLYELSLPYGLDMNDQIDIDKSQTRISITIKNLPTEKILELEQRITGWANTHLKDITFTNASPALMFAHIGKRNVGGMLMGTTMALILVSFVLVLALRSMRLGLISLAPNLLPAGMAFGIWGICVGQVGLSLSVVAGMTLGIVVDDTVHFLSKYIHARRDKGFDAQKAVRYSFNTVGIALWITSLVLVMGFLVLGQSHFSLNADMGIMAALTIGIALIMDFLFLPALLMHIEGKNNA